MDVGTFHRRFYVRKEEIPIYPLLPEELNYLIYDTAFEQSLSRRLRQAKDVFVFGCTTALRVSDLLALTRSDIRTSNGIEYLSVRSRKTGSTSQMLLPDYASEILKKYQHQKALILPHFNKGNLNKYIKILLREAGFLSEVNVERERRGIPACAERKRTKRRFCDIASSHTMRRTAITFMLCLGMPEQVVRQISGHSPGSKEFYRYVHWAQTYQDQETSLVFLKLKEKHRMPA